MPPTQTQPIKPITATQGTQFYSPQTGQAQGIVNFDAQTGQRLAQGATTTLNPIQNAATQPKIDPTIIGTQPLAIPNPIQNTTAQNNLQTKVDTTFNNAQTGVPAGWDAVTYANFKAANPNLEPTPEDTARMQAAGTPGGQRQGFASQLQDIFTKQGTKTARTNEIQQQEGVQQKKDIVRGLENQALALDNSFNKRVTSLLGDGGMTREQAAPQVQELQRMQNSQKADLAIQSQVAQGNYQSAYEIAQSKVEAEFAPLDAQLNNLKTQIDLFQNDMTASEKMKADQAYQTQRDALDFARQKQLISYRAAIDAASTKASGGKLVKINGTDYIQNADGSFSTPNVPGSGQNTTNAQGQIDAISALLGNTKGLKASVGTTGLFGRGGNLDFGASRGEFQAGIQQLTSQLTLDNLIAAKARGATFGALSEGELNILAGGATKLNTWAKKDKNGNITGFKTSEANVKRELDKISNFAKKDFILKGGDPASVGATVLVDGVWVQNSDGSYTKL